MTFLIFFPSINFSLFSAEIFPWALIYSLTRIKAVPPVLVAIVAVFYFSFAFVTLAYQGVYIADGVRSVAAYLNPLVAFFFLRFAPISEIQRIIRLLKAIVGFLLILGTLQYLSLLSPLEPFLKLLIPRASGDLLSGARGVTLLSSEPSRASVELIFMYFVLRSCSKLSNRKLLLLDILFSLFVVIAIRSAIGAGILMMAMLLQYQWRALIPSVVLLAFFLRFFDSVRAVDVLATVLEQQSLEDTFEFILNQSGFRVVSVLSSYHSAFQNFFGHGIGTWSDSSISAMSALGFQGSDISYFQFRSDGEFIGVRPTSFFASIALELGLFGLALVSFAVLRECFTLLMGAGARVFPLMAIFIFTSYFVGSVGNPIPWICIVVACRILAVQTEQDCNSSNRQSQSNRRDGHDLQLQN